MEEKTDIEQMCIDINSKSTSQNSILFTPKFHCELAGEGIEYAWGMMKRLYRKQPMKVKRSSRGFHELVRTCSNSVSINSARLFSAKARRYMVVYHHRRLELKNAITKGVVSEWSHEKTEMIHTIYRSHCDVNIIDGVFIAKVMRDCIGIKDENKIYHTATHNCV